MKAQFVPVWNCSQWTLNFEEAAPLIRGGLDGLSILEALGNAAMETQEAEVARLTSVCGHDPLVRMDSHFMPSNFSGHCTCTGSQTSPQRYGRHRDRKSHLSTSCPHHHIRYRHDYMYTNTSKQQNYAKIIRKYMLRHKIIVVFITR